MEGQYKPRNCLNNVTFTLLIMNRANSMWLITLRGTRLRPNTTCVKEGWLETLQGTLPPRDIPADHTQRWVCTTSCTSRYAGVPTHLRAWDNHIQSSAHRPCGFNWPQGHVHRLYWPQGNAHRLYWPHGHAHGHPYTLQTTLLMGECMSRWHAHVRSTDTPTPATLTLPHPQTYFTLDP